MPAGIAVTGSVFDNQLAASHGHFASAFRHGVVSIAAFVAVCARARAGGRVHARLFHSGWSQ